MSRTVTGQVDQASLNDNSSYSVLYTSRLFGYFRYPEAQERHSGQHTSTCDGPIAEQSTPEAYEFGAFVSGLRSDGRGTDVLVSTGDNFAPFLLARRELLFDGKTPPHLAPKESNELENDNVVCFLRRMHFDAIVPGKHDFYFGPERLRELAKSLIEGDDAVCSQSPRFALEPGNGSCRVAMLGANLYLKTRLTKFSEKAKTQYSGSVSAALPKVVTPWMRQVTVTGVGSDPTRAPIAFLSSSECHQRIFLEADRPLGKDQLVYVIPARADGANVSRHEVLIPDCTYFVNLQSLPNPIGQFTVSYPFLSDSRKPSDPPTSNLNFSSDSIRWPWTEVALRNGGKAVIFGVVDPNLAEYVGKLNYTWLGTDDNGRVVNNYETVVQVSDPAEALSQVLQYCEQIEGCRTAHKILLAQMPQGKIYQELSLLRRTQTTMPIELVITEADPDAATGNRRTELSQAEGAGDASLSRPTVLVPGVHFGIDPNASPYALRVRLQVVTVASTPRTRVIDNRVLVDQKQVNADPLGNRTELVCPNGPTPNGPCSRVTTLAAELNRAVRDNKSFFQHPLALNPSDLLEVARQVALESMRNACHSDVAMLQDRDLFPADRDLLLRPVSAAGLNAVVSALFWKGDFVQCLNLSGDNLQNILKRSGELKAQEETGLVTELSRGWWLRPAGLQPAASQFAVGAGKLWIVNGDYLDPKKLYSVATTDYIANGDTGYPTLQGAEPPPPIPLSKIEILDLTDLVTRAIGFGDAAVTSPADVLDVLNRSQQIPERAKQPTFPNWLKSWTMNDTFSSQPESFDTHQQKYPIFSVKLYKLDFAYALFQHNGTEGSIPRRFPGVTSVDLSNTGNFMYTADYQLRTERTGARLGSYFESDLNFGRNNKRSNAKPGGSPCFPGTLNTCYQSSQTANYWYQEGGVAVRLTPDHQNPSGLKALLPLGFKTQVAKPYTQIASVNPAPKGATPVTGPSLVSAPRNYYLAFRPGLRYEHSFPRDPATTLSPAKGKTAAPSAGKTYYSYVEGGLETGQVFHSPSAYHFAGLSGPSGSSVCPENDGLVPVNILAACLDQTSIINANTPLDKVIAGRNFWQQGLYLNFRLDMPLPLISKPEFLVENRGDFFFKRSTDLEVDTRFLNDLSATVLFPIWNKVSIGPAAEVVLFKTKGNVPGNYYFNYSTSIAISYSFDWRPGLKAAKVAGYGNSDTAPIPLPSR